MGITKGQNHFSALKTPFLSLLWSKTYHIKKNPTARIIQKLPSLCDATHQGWRCSHSGNGAGSRTHRRCPISMVHGTPAPDPFFLNSNLSFQDSPRGNFLFGSRKELTIAFITPHLMSQGDDFRVHPSYTVINWVSERLRKLARVPGSPRSPYNLSWKPVFSDFV